MPFRHHAALRCPLDQLPLQMCGSTLRCPDGHSFDIARQGYANLLLAQQKRSRDPGDSKAMIAARHRFLEAGYYQPIADRLGELLLPCISGESLVVDAGCGEGYYLQRLRQQLRDAAAPEPGMLGFDISKSAMQIAARRFPASWLVASNRNIPLAAESADIVLDAFGFPDFAAFNRLLKPAGLLLRIQAGDHHLVEIRNIIYPRLRSRKNAYADPAGFTRTNSVHLQYSIAGLEQAVIKDLLLMTPHLFRASAEGKKQLAGMHEMAVTVDVSIDILCKNQDLPETAVPG